jgi:ABC-2 type transport system permease protein
VRALLLIARREWYALFATPTAWVLATLFQFLGGLLFLFVLESARFADLGPFYFRLTALLPLVVPIVAMGRLAGERRQGTMELLLTSPVAPWQIVGGKYLGVLGFVGLLTVLSLQYPLILSAYASPDPGQWIPATAGFALTGALLAAIGIFATALTSNQILAGILTLAISLLLWWAHNLGPIVGFEAGTLHSRSSLLHRFLVFNQGTIDSRDLYYFLGLSAFFLTLAARGVESDRW